ncbi:endo-1,4-beta-xylanase [Hymenobacter sp. GOD-10R]|uniref:endo-1,4-beta-xylanase n=1 Tax=Hymenobacter sp. GOD-10R TaxID=3093922 RepID=UPI002D79DEFA|nr:endo-1,4-beta-xylanase [Hymenobacter sp. GOD-10R]WRQ29537.1 endo-1,4-beta-xylanase [Hymenobacter sp. GOD-10R]
MKTQLFLSMLSLGLLTYCIPNQQTGEDNPGPTTPAVTGLKQLAPFPMGAAVNVSLLKTRPAYEQTVATEYNSLTAENAMKFASLHPAQTTYTWSDADYIVTYAQQHNARVHGHTLVWYKSLPSWVTGFQGDSAAWENLMKTHIQTVVTHFKGKVASWDVVNEAFEDNGTLRNSVWRQHLGPDFIARAFQYAHEADPAALLFYNDYGHEWGPTKRTAILNLVNGLKSRGIPIHGIGLQMHTNSNRADSNLATAINTAAQTGLKVHIAELDIAMNPDKTAGLAFTPAIAAAQKAKYKAIVQAFKALPAAQRFGITTWNVGDADTWIRGSCSCSDWPLPFDDNYQRKPAYDGIVEALQ